MAQPRPMRFVVALGTLNLIAYGLLQLEDSVQDAPMSAADLYDSDAEERLLVDLFRGYQPLVTPTNQTVIEVSLGLQLILLINMDERNQVMQTNVWMSMTWHDSQMKWDPNSYSGIESLRVPPDKLWLPDIVLFNNADGNYLASFYSNAMVYAGGRILWVPPALFKSSCIINVEHFPFDQQECYMQFGSWTYSEDEVELKFYRDVKGVDLSQFVPSTIWDIVDAPAYITRKDKIEFMLQLRRKPLFYTWVLLIPTVLMAFLSMTVFYMPTQTKEKIGLSIYILVSIDVFLLLVSKILPEQSRSIPLMAKYLLLTLILNVITILITVIIINVFYRTPATHRMPEWVRVVFLDILAKLLLMKRPRRRTLRESRVRSPSQDSLLNYTPAAVPLLTVTGASHYPGCPYSQEGKPPPPSSLNRHSEADQQVLRQRRHRNAAAGLSADGWRVIKSIEFITDHVKDDELKKKVCEDWRYVGMVIDRLQLYTFFGVTLGGTIGIFLSAPNLFSYVNQQEKINEMAVKYDWAETSLLAMQTRADPM